jgi:hypothetical protein
MESMEVMLYAFSNTSFMHCPSLLFEIGLNRVDLWEFDVGPRGSSLKRMFLGSSSYIQSSLHWEFLIIKLYVIIVSCVLFSSSSAVCAISFCQFCLSLIRIEFYE